MVLINDKLAKNPNAPVMTKNMLAMMSVHPKYSTALAALSNWSLLW
jgi:hypothetical protein